MADVLNAAAEALRDPISLRYGRGGMSAKFDAIDLLRALRAAGFDVVPTTKSSATERVRDQLRQIISEATGSGRGRLDSDEWQEEDEAVFLARMDAALEAESCTTTTSVSTGDATPPPSAESATTTPEGIPARRMNLEEALTAMALEASVALGHVSIIVIREWEPRIRRVVEAEIDERIRSMFGWVEERNGQPAPDR